MTDPLSLLPLAVAAHGGRVDDFEAQQLVAAGFTLLRRCAPLVRALAGRRSGILLPTSPQFVIALAASEDRGAVLINPLATPAEITFQIEHADVGAVFTSQALASRVPDAMPRVLLDEAPRRARLLHGGVSRDVDLGEHTPLSVKGETDTPGSEDEAVVVFTSAMAGQPLGAVLEHRSLLSNARSTVMAARKTNEDRWQRESLRRRDLCTR